MRKFEDYFFTQNILHEADFIRRNSSLADLGLFFRQGSIENLNHAEADKPGQH